MTKATLFERALGFFSPGLAIRRIKSRVQFGMLAGGYNGASRSRGAMRGWSVQRGDADSDILPDLPTLRERSADLIRNNPIAGAASNTKVTHVVGTGLKLNATVDRELLGITEEAAAAFQSAAEREWRLWSRSADCDVQRELTFAEQQELAFRAVLDAGDHFVLLTKASHPGSVYTLALQHIESDRVCNKDHKTDDATATAGVVKNALGAPIAYDVLTSHPGNAYGVGSTWERIPAFGKKTGRRVTLHLYRKERTGQTRGIPDLAPVIEPIKQLGRYTEAEVDAAVKNASFALMLKTATGDGMGMAGLEYNDWLGTRKDYYKEQPVDLTGGESSVIGLFPDDDIQSFDPNRPNTAFDPFMSAMLGLISARLEIPKDVLTKNFQASYSAARAALLELHRFVIGRRAWLATKMCQPVYEQFLAEAVASGRLNAPGFFSDAATRAAYSAAEWIGDAAGNIDETKAAAAARERIESGLSTFKREIPALTGEDYETTKRQREREGHDVGQKEQPPAAPQATADDLDDADKRENQQYG